MAAQGLSLPGSNATMMDSRSGWRERVHAITRSTTQGKGKAMKTRSTVALAIIVGFGLGAVTVEGLRAQAKPPVYFIAEIDVKDVDAYTKEYAPRAQAIIKKHGGRLLAAGQKVTAFEGAPPKPRVAIQVWDSMEKLQAWRNSEEFKEARKIGVKYATFRTFAIEGLPQH
jgi:uncharacterized protein (DUF1330 family)